LEAEDVDAGDGGVRGGVDAFGEEGFDVGHAEET
jgi:hypothetical protein